jgi:hypothetical protein
MAEHDRDGEDLVFGRTGTEAFFASTIRARANKSWRGAALEPITPHEAVTVPLKRRKPP